MQNGPNVFMFKLMYLGLNNSTLVQNVHLAPNWYLSDLVHICPNCSILDLKQADILKVVIFIVFVTTQNRTSDKMKWVFCSVIPSCMCVRWYLGTK